MPIVPTSIRAAFLPNDPLGMARFGWSSATKRYFVQVVRLDLDGTDDLQLFRERIHTAQGVASILSPWVRLDAETVAALDRDRFTHQSINQEEPAHARPYPKIGR